MSADRGGRSTGTEPGDGDSATGGAVGAAPGSRIVGWIAAIVPASRRTEWLIEWRSELAYSCEEWQASNTSRAWWALRLRVRAAGDRKSVV